MRRARLVIAAAVCLLVPTWPSPAAADGDDGPEYRIVNPTLPPVDVGGDPSFVMQGTLGGAGYIIELPPEWNGELVMWAHGYRGEGTDLTVDPPGYGMRQRLLDLGYAWAASSYDANGYDVGSGVRSTRELARKFRVVFGRPDRTYIAGVSMGGHVTARSIEQYPQFYDGAMPLCGVVGDVELFDFFLDYLLVAQALTGIDATPVSADYPALAAQMKQVLGIAIGPPSNALGEQFRAVVIEQSGGPRPGAAVAFEAWKDFLFGLPTPDDGLPLAFNPGRIATNVGTDYSPDAPVNIDAVVERLEPVDARARRSRRLGPIPLIEGDHRVPVLSLHDLGDLFVPFSMEQEYAADAAANDNSDLLVQRAIRAIGHCEFSPAEVSTAFDDLVEWVEAGVRPAGDDVLAAATVADPNYGCTFSDPNAYSSGSRPAFARCP